MNALRIFLREIRIEHTLFALPFAYVGAIVAARGMPSWWALLWITLAVLGARTAAMAANRYLDRDIDARNPRTAKRALATGRLAPAVMLWATLLGLALLLVSAWQLNPLCVELMPLAALGLLLYPLCKRFTWLTHFVLGAVDALAPLGAYIGVAGRVDAPALQLFRVEGVRSLPVRFGAGAGRILSIVMHVAMLVALALAGVLAGAHPIYAVGLLLAVGLIVLEVVFLRRSANVFVLNERIFTANMAFSVLFLATTAAAFIRGV
ncbi:MAG: UbiA family prenyltransferase [Bacillati bacterium]